MTEFLAKLDAVCNTLDHCGIQFIIGGSVASSLWSRPRQTNDVDFAIRARAGSDACLAGSLGEDYVVFPREWASLDLSSSYPWAEVTHISGDFRCDLFLVLEEPFSESEFNRAVSTDLGMPTPQPVATAEDIVIQKLRWYVLGNRVSDLQWNDIVQVLEVQAGKLDYEYMRRWSRHFQVDELLEQAISETDPFG